MNFPHNRIVHNLQEATIVNDMDKVLRTCVALENQQVGHKLSIFKVEGKFFRKSMLILIKSFSCKNFISPRIVDQCMLHKNKFQQA